MKKIKIRKTIEKVLGYVIKKKKSLKAFQKPTVVMRKTYQKKSRKKLVVITLTCIVIVLAIVILVSLFLKNRKDVNHSLPEDKKYAELQTAGKVVEADNLGETFPLNGEIIAQGRFNDVEQQVKGKALFVKNDEGFFLRLENLEMVNGQDMHIYLSPILNLDSNDAIDVGILKAITGDMNYNLNKNIDLEKYNNVLIWSNRFDAFFGYAVLQKGELPPEVVPNENEENQNDVESSAEDQIIQIQEEKPQEEQLEIEEPLIEQENEDISIEEIPGD